tara:strand:- start:2283 stop:2864 length:582 start_codon:yes stop_codon:yes gene_type:complete
LARKDPILARAIDLTGIPEPRKYVSGYAALLRIIISQQVSNSAGAAIWKKLDDHARGVTADKICRFNDKTLRKCGLSRSKVKYAKITANAVCKGELDLKQLESLSDELVRSKLISYKGIGPWTAEVYLMFALKRPDVFPSGDLALAISVKDLLHLDVKPNPNELATIAERWRPYRSAAATLLWQYYKYLSQMG